MKKIGLLFLLISTFSFAQTKDILLIKKQIRILNDTVSLEQVSISPLNFKLLDEKNNKIDSTKYKILFSKGKLIIKDTTLLQKQLKIQYTKYPQFLTKTYKTLDTSLIVNQSGKVKLFQIQKQNRTQTTQIFKGLNTEGNIRRGITFGNNQDGVLDSNLELRIQGDLSDKVKIRANIIDSNIPVQNNGYTQRLDEYDKIFVELFTDKWLVTAGDLYLENRDLKYLNFRKKVAGLAINSKLGDSINNKNFTISGAVVRGQFKQVDFKGQNGNQGPYNIINLENAYWLILADSETVFVNGKKINRGKDADYTIDYNTAEIIFNPTFPIHSDMRIHVEFQVSDQNYTRFVSYNEAHFKSPNKFIQVSFYNENDAKNNPINQSLTQEQLQILQDVGDNQAQMFVPSAVPEEFDANKIQYKKELQNAIEIFVFSNNPNDNLYHVNFTYVGKNNGDYNIAEILANGKVFEYISPISNVKQGSYSPVIPLVAPNKLQLLNLKSVFNPKEKININTELSINNYDKNLFSSKDDSDNIGFAGNIQVDKKFRYKTWQFSSDVYNEFITDNFKSIERIQQIEFNRNWNLQEQEPNKQNLFKFGFIAKKDSIFKLQYTFNNLNLKSKFNGNKHQIGFYKTGKLRFNSVTDLLNSASLLERTTYFLNNSTIKLQLKNKWIGSSILTEDNQRKDVFSNKLNALSFKNNYFKLYFGLGNKEKIFTEVGYQFRKNDSIQNYKFKEIEKANSIYLQSKLLNNKVSNLQIFANYEINNSIRYNTTKFLNTQILYKQNLWNNGVHLNFDYQTNSGNLPQQDFIYIQVEPGHGYYQWIDYNGDSIKDIDEFEIAVFQDQATYLRVALPTVTYIQTNQNKLKTSVLIRFSEFLKNKKNNKILSHFINQTNLFSDIKRPKTNEFIHLNPLDYKDNSVLSVQYNFNNNLYFNRGKQHYSLIWSYINGFNKSVFITGFQENLLEQHKFQMIHLFSKKWLLDLEHVFGYNTSNFETFTQRNFYLLKNVFSFKMDYLQSKIFKLGVVFSNKNSENRLGDKEILQALNYGFTASYKKNEKASVLLQLNWINNDFTGNTLSPVAYQMLEGLQSGKNYTWQVIGLKKINDFLDLNLIYNGRKSELSKTIHVGSVQLRANF